MQPVGPYRFTEALGVCSVGTAWWAVDGQDRLVTVAVLEGPAAADQAWRAAFANAAQAMAQAPDGQRYVNADFATAKPWAAYPSEEGMGAQRLFQSLGMELHPAEFEAEAVTARLSLTGGAPNPEVLPQPPVSAPPQPASAPSQLPWTPQPWAMASQPTSGVPVSPAAPVSAPAAPTAPDPLDPSEGRRIAPVGRPPRRRTGQWVAAVVVIAAFGAGLVLGNALGGEAEPAIPSASASPPLYEATQQSLNKAKFDGELLPLAEPWLTRMGGCATDTEVGGIKPLKGEKRHIFCRYGGLAVHFALYESAAEKEAARVHREQMGIAGRALAPGLREAEKSTGGVSRAAGSYVEYAAKGHDGRAMCGIWWGRDDTMVALYFETPCEAGIGGNFDALRDLWRRTS